MIQTAEQFERLMEHLIDGQKLLAHWARQKGFDINAQTYDGHAIEAEFFIATNKLKTDKEVKYG